MEKHRKGKQNSKGQKKRHGGAWYWSCMQHKLRRRILRSAVKPASPFPPSAISLRLESPPTKSPPSHRLAAQASSVNGVHPQLVSCVPVPSGFQFLVFVTCTGITPPHYRYQRQIFAPNDAHPFWSTEKLAATLHGCAMKALLDRPSGAVIQVPFQSG